MIFLYWVQAASSAAITLLITPTTSVVSVTGWIWPPIFRLAEPGMWPPSCLIRLASCWAWAISPVTSAPSDFLISSARTPSRLVLLAR